MMKTIPLSLKESNNFVQRYHRHHSPVHRDKFRIGCMDNGKLVGVANVGRPVSRYLDNGETLEVLRCCTDGTKNACSFLYSHCARVARELGYKRIITYILETESGESLKASGWELDNAICGGGHWDTPSRPRKTGKSIVHDLLGERVTSQEAPICAKQRWQKIL